MEERIFQSFIVWSVRGLAFFGLAVWKGKYDRKNLDPRAKVVIEEGERLGLRIQRLKLLGKETELFRARKDGREIIFKHIPVFNSYCQTRQVWIDDKWRAKQILAERNLPVVPAKLISTLDQALAAAQELGYPVIIKPRRGSLSKGVYIDIFNQKDLIKSFQKSKRVYPKLLIEPQIKGHDYRITLIGGEVRGAVRREPANVVGDGRLTIRELIIEKNQSPLRGVGRSTTLKKISLAHLPNHYLRRKRVDLDNIPEKGEKVILHYKVNLASGADLIDVTEKIHPDNKTLFEKIGRIFDSEIIGIDFKSRDISQSYKRNKGRILELNSLPYLNMHHQPWQGKKIPIARYLWQRYLG